MDSTNFDAIEFRTKVSGKEKKRIRVYYQTADHKIRESCYDEDDGWFINGNGIVSSDARGSSPITVTRWIGLNDDVQVILLHNSSSSFSSVYLQRRTHSLPANPP